MAVKSPDGLPATDSGEAKGNGALKSSGRKVEAWSIDT